MSEMGLRDLLIENRNEILATAARHGAEQIRLIGSVARGTDGPESDIDFLVTWEPWTSLFDSAALSEELEQLLGRKVDLASDGWVRPELRESVYRDARPL
jgi:predicted nucleotidyltransferase